MRVSGYNWCLGGAVLAQHRQFMDPPRGRREAPALDWKLLCLFRAQKALGTGQLSQFGQ